MKKIMLLLTMLCVALSQLSAQRTQVMWGITAGANITQVDAEGRGFLNSGWRSDASNGYWIGGQVRIALPISGLGLDGSFTYAQETATLASSGVMMSDRLRYFSIPIHARYDLEFPGTTEILIPFIFVGPQINLSLNDFDWFSLVSRDPLALLDEKTANFNLDNKTNKQVWKLDMGFGAIFLSHVQLAYNYSIPINDTFKFRTVYEEGRNNFKLGTHRIGVTYFF